jgi:hypothetical protein
MKRRHQIVNDIVEPSPPSFATSPPKFSPVKIDTAFTTENRDKSHKTFSAVFKAIAM